MYNGCFFCIVGIMNGLALVASIRVFPGRANAERAQLLNEMKCTFKQKKDIYGKAMVAHGRTPGVDSDLIGIMEGGSATAFDLTEYPACNEWTIQKL